MQIKLNNENRGVIQGIVKKLVTEGERTRFLLRSELCTVPCRVDCRIPEGLKDGDFVTVFEKVRYSNDNNTHKLIVERVKSSQPTITPLNFHMLEGYPLGPVVYANNKLTFTLRSNTLTPGGEVYRCLTEVMCYGKVAERLHKFIKAESMYMVIGSLVTVGKKLTMVAEYAKDSTAITREV